MHWFKKYVESGKLSVIYRILLVVWDAVCIPLPLYLSGMS